MGLCQGFTLLEEAARWALEGPALPHIQLEAPQVCQLWLTEGKSRIWTRFAQPPTPFPARGEAESRLVEKGREGRGGEQGGGAASPTNHLASPHPSSICRFIKSRANSGIISFKQLHLAGVRNLFEIKKTITERQQSSKTTSET